VPCPSHLPINIRSLCLLIFRKKRPETGVQVDAINSIPV
jgi:hypothetical protein